MALTDEQVEQLLARMDADSRQMTLLITELRKMFGMKGVFANSTRWKLFTYVNQKALEKDLAQRHPDDIAVWIAEAKDYFGPMLERGIPAVDNSFIYLVFSEGVFSDTQADMPVNSDCFNIIFRKNGSAGITDFSVSEVTKKNGGALTGGERIIRLELNITGTPSGVETVEVIPKLNSIFDADGRPVSFENTSGEIVLFG